MTFSTIDDFYVSDADLEQSPSAKQGISRSDERMLRRFGATLLWQACLRTELPMSVYSTAAVLLQRFYCKESLTEYDVRVMACAVFWMACKLEEVIECDDPSTLRLRDVLIMFYDCVTRGAGGTELRTEHDVSKMNMLNIYSPFYASFKDAVIKAERDLLRCFGFVMHVEHAVPFVLTLGAQLGMAGRKEVLQTACDIASDSLRTTLCVRVKAECVACAALFLAAQRHGYALPDGWWEGCGVEWDSMETCCRAVVDMYEESDANKDEGARLAANLSPPFLAFDPSNGSDSIVLGSDKR